MRVRQLIGPHAGRIVDMPEDVAQSCLAQGTACKIDDIPRVRGLSIAPGKAREAIGEDGEPVTIPEDWADLDWPALRSLAARLSERKIVNKQQAEAAVAAALEAK